MEYRLSADKSIVSGRVFILFSFSFVFFVGVLFFYFLDNRYISITAEKQITAAKGAELWMPVAISNRTHIHFNESEKYYLSGRIKKVGSNDPGTDLPRTVIDLKPWGRVSSAVHLVSPIEEGEYQIDISIVKEGEYWLSDKGERPFKMLLTVKGQE